MKELHQIIKKPLITEKSTRLKEAENQIAFVVDSGANKVQIRHSVRRLVRQFLGRKREFADVISRRAFEGEPEHFKTLLLPGGQAADEQTLSRTVVD